MTPSQTHAPRPLMPYRQGIRAASGGNPLLPTTLSGVTTWDSSQPADDYYEDLYPALARSDKAILASLLGSLAPQATSTIAMRQPLFGNNEVYQTVNAYLSPSHAWLFDDATVGSLMMKYDTTLNAEAYYWYGLQAGNWELMMGLTFNELNVGAAGGGPRIHLVQNLGGSITQNATMAPGQWTPDVATNAAFNLWMDAASGQYIFQYAAAPLPTPIVWTNLATLDPANGLTMLNGMTVVAARDPIHPLEVATKQYVDSAIQGMGGGIPPGGATGAMLTKTSTANFATDWETADGGTY